jgi:hypothetical protein
MRLRRKQIYLDEETERQLAEVTLVRRASESAVVREALKEYFRRVWQERESRPNPLEELAGGLGDGPGDAAERHDFYLYQADKD